LSDSEHRVQLVEAARVARGHAIATYSHFKVGAALRTRGGLIYSGCNVENASYGLTMCAERVALFTALAAGERDFVEVVVVADTEAPTPPCGPCRQLLWEFCGDIPVILATPSRIAATLQMRDLLPLPFDGRLLNT
jgi:cytidine deaminase